ncbi:MAG: ATP-dependent DNA helicase RecG [Parcubacteria group bacterium]
MNLSTPIHELTRVGKTTASRLKKLGLETVEDLIFYFPFRYEDFSLIKKIKDLIPNEPVTIRAKVQMIANRRSWRRKKMLTEAFAADDTETIKVIWFNQPFLTKTIRVGDEIYLSGKLDETNFQMVSPDYEKVKINAIHTARLIPIYHLTEGVTQKQLRFLLSQAMLAIDSVDEFLPLEILNKYQFLNLKQALVMIHFPDNLVLAENAGRRLKFDELFLIQLAIQIGRKKAGDQKAPKIAFLEKQTKDFVDGLSFKLTNAQKKCSWEIIKDLEKEKPMNRLLEGDVGSGKTAVMAIAALNVALNGYKTCLMAPTEILATQHYQTLIKLFKKQKFSVVLLTANKKEIDGKVASKKEILEKLKSGEFDLAVGTHAVIQDSVQINELGLVVVDEQHRFGVEQRKSLLANNSADKILAPHFLSMTATPIPRSLLLALYGDLKLSIINEMPAGRKKIVTKVVYEQQRLETYDFIRKQVNEGRQVFVICPLIDPSDKLGFKSVKMEFEKLKNVVFTDLNIGMMHGRLKGEEKQEVMAKFCGKEINILVSTSVIEVGIDIPNASVMMIEGAERFGLAQLHQFRGRVGRGAHQSYCFLFSESGSPDRRKRLHYMETCGDGFKLAEKDLELRGPGEVYGVRQSGLPDLRIASLADTQTMKIAQAEASEIIINNKMTPELKKALEKVEVNMHFE